jgi:alkaline phosphatase D
MFEAIANGDGPALGREIEIAGLLSAIRHAGIRNVVWLTADVHYTAAHRYDPARASYTDFAPFWEFVSGPLQAGTFGPNAPDDTFGLEVVWQKAPDGRINVPPSEGMQYFGEVAIDGKSGAMTVLLKDMSGATLWQRSFEPERA